MIRTSLNHHCGNLTNITIDELVFHSSSLAIIPLVPSKADFTKYYDRKIQLFAQARRPKNQYQQCKLQNVRYLLNRNIPNFYA